MVLIRPADEGPVIRRVGKDVEGLAVFRNLGQQPGRKGLQLLLLGGLPGRDGLKARRDQQILLVFAVGVLLAQPRARARSAQALIRLNAVSMCFIDLYSSG